MVDTIQSVPFRSPRASAGLLGAWRGWRTLLRFWWSHVVFPMPCPKTDERRWAGLVGLAAAVVFFGAGFLFFTQLDLPLQEPDEVRYAEVPRQMMEADQLVVPVKDGTPYLDKPPLLYWLVMGSYRINGVHDWSARLVSCLASFLVVLLSWAWARQTLGTRAALAGALVLTLSARFVYLGRMLTPDSLLCLFTVLSWMGLHLALSGPRLRWGWWLLAALGCGLGTLTKGPVALVLVLVPVLLWQWLDTRLVRPGWKAWCAWGLTMLGVAAPWYAAVCVREPVFVEHFFWRHNVRRYLAAFDHSEPFWFYLPGLLLGTLPWSLLLPALLRFVGRLQRRTRQRRPAALGFFLLAFLWCLMFFSCSGSKRAGYILPAFPPLALTLGYYLSLLLPSATMLEKSIHWWQRGSRLSLRLACIAAVAGAAGALAAVPTRLMAPHLAIILAVAAAALLVVLLRRRPAELSWPAGSAVLFAVIFLALHCLLPRYAERFSLRDQVYEQTVQAGGDLEVICFPRRWDSVSYYLRRQDVRTYSTEQMTEMYADLCSRAATLVFVKPGDAYEQFQLGLPHNLEFVTSSKEGLAVVGWVRRRFPRGDFPTEKMLLAGDN